MPEQIIGKLREVDVLVQQGHAVREAVRRIGVSDHTYGVKAMFIEPGSPWENGYVESFNGKFRDELLNREVFSTLTEARILIEWWRKEYNQVRPHSSLGYRPPAPQTILPTMLKL